MTKDKDKPFDPLDRHMRNAQIVCLALLVVNAAYLVYLILTGQ